MRMSVDRHPVTSTKQCVLDSTKGLSSSLNFSGYKNIVLNYHNMIISSYLYLANGNNIFLSKCYPMVMLKQFDIYS